MSSERIDADSGDELSSVGAYAPSDYQVRLEAFRLGCLTLLNEGGPAHGPYVNFRTQQAELRLVEGSEYSYLVGPRHASHSCWCLIFCAVETATGDVLLANGNVFEEADGKLRMHAKVRRQQKRGRGNIFDEDFGLGRMTRRGPPHA